MIQKQAAEAVIVVLIYEKSKKKGEKKKKERKRKKKRRVWVKTWLKTWLKRRNNLQYYETLLQELRSEGKFDYNILLRMTSENFEEIFHLIKYDKTIENTEITELIPPTLLLAVTIGFLSTG